MACPRPFCFPPIRAFRESRDREESTNHLRRGAIAAAALAHVAVITAMIVHWPNLFPSRAARASAHPGDFGHRVPPPPPPQAKPAPPPPPPRRRSNSSKNASRAPTQKPPRRRNRSIKAKRPRRSRHRLRRRRRRPKPPTSQPNPRRRRKKKPSKRSRKLAKRETTPKPARGSVNRAPGERETEGDPYLNALFALIQSHRFYPRNAVGSLGLPLEGTAVYLIKICADGALMDFALERSSGANILDQTALTMIRQAAPFPPLPQNEFPGPSVVLEVTIHLFPGMG